MSISNSSRETTAVDSGQDGQRVVEQQDDSTSTYRNAIKKHNMLLRIIFFLLGVGILIPWNAFISAIVYFQLRFCRANEEAGDLGQLGSTFSIVYNVSSVLSLGLLVFSVWFNDQRHVARENALPSEMHGEQATQSTGAATGRSPTSGEIAESSTSSSSGSDHSFWLVIVPLTVYFLVFLSQAMAVLWIDLNPSVIYAWTVSSLAICGICGALASSGIVATAGLFLADIAMEPYLAGQSAGGLGVSLVNFMAATAEDTSSFWNSHCSQDNNPDGQMRALENPNDVIMDHPSDLMAVRRMGSCSSYTRVDHAVLCYFLLGSMVLAACLFGFAYIDRFQRREHRDEYEIIHDHETMMASDEAPTDASEESPGGLQMSKTHSQQLGTNRNEENYQGTSSSTIARLKNSSAVIHAADVSRRGIGETAVSLGQGSFRTALDVYHDTTEDDEIVDEFENHHTDNETNDVLIIVRGPAFSICMVFVVTLSLFPGWVSQLRSVHRCSDIDNRMANDLFTPFVFVWFNFFDFTGRIVAGYVPLPRMHHVSAKLVTASLLRFSFFPLLYFCATDRGGEKWTIGSDMYTWVILAAFALSNGFVVTLAFVHAPFLLPNVTHVQERSAGILNFALYIGLLTGSLLSVPALRLFTG